MTAPARAARRTPLGAGEIALWLLGAAASFLALGSTTRFRPVDEAGRPAGVQ